MRKQSCHHHHWTPAETAYVIRIPYQKNSSLEPNTCQQSPGGQEKHLKDIRINLKNFHTNSSNWEGLAQNRTAWTNSLHEWATLHEDELSSCNKWREFPPKPTFLLQHLTSMPPSLWFQNWPLQPFEDQNNPSGGNWEITDVLHRIKTWLKFEK